MSRRVFVLDGHPGRDTLCGALAEAYVAGAEARGHEVRVLRLADMAFDIDMEEGYGSKKPLEPCLEAVQEHLTWCEHLALVHPLWWGGVPAKLKGLFDRALLPGFAFAYEKGKHFPTKLLTGRSAEVLVTADTPAWYLHLALRAGGYRAMKTQILGFCGFRPVRFKTFSSVHESNPDQRKRWIEAARARGGAL